MQTSESFISNKFGEQYLYSINRNAFLNQSAEIVFDKYFEEKLWSEEKFNVISGCDSGLLLLYVYYHGIPDDSKFLFVEQSNIIEILNTLIDLSLLGDNIKVVNQDEWLDAAKDMGIATYLYSSNVAYHRSICSIDDYEGQYHDIHLNILENIEALTFQQNSSLGNQFFTESQLNNLSENYHSAFGLKGIYKGKTAVVIGGGPSLDESIDWMKENRDKLAILAVSRVAKRLLESNLIPDMVFCVDPFSPSYDVSKELLNMPEHVLFIHNNSANNRLVSQWSGAKAYLGTLFPWDSKQNSENLNGMGPTVTNTVLNCAIGMGFEKVLLVGVDLCYSKAGVSHAKGSEEANHGAALHHDGLWVETYLGDIVETTIPYNQAANVIEAQAAMANNLNIEVINLSPNAKKLKNIPFVNKDDVIFQHDAFQLREQSQHYAPSLEINRAHIALSQKEISKIQNELIEIKKLSQKAIKLNAALYDSKLSDEKKSKSKIQLDNIESKLSNKFASASEFIKRYGMRYFIKVVTPQSHENWADDKMEELGRLYYQAYIDSSDALSKLMANIQIHLTQRHKELSFKLSAEDLVKEWSEHKILGRSKLYRTFAKQGNKVLCEKDIDILNNSINEFQDELEGKTTFQYIAAQANVQFNANLLSRKIRRLFQKKHADGLALLINNLKIKPKDEPGWYQISMLAQAYLYCLNKQDILAISFFEKLPLELRQDDELRVLATLYLRATQPEKAEEVLATLSLSNKIFLAQYAKISALNNNIEQAIKAYDEYLALKPNDLSTLIEISELLMKHGMFSRSKGYVQQALELAPSNQSLISLMQELQHL